MNHRICITKHRVRATRQEHNAENQNRANLECRGDVQQVCALSCSQDIHCGDYGDHDHCDDFYLHGREVDELSEIVAKSDRQSCNRSRTDHEEHRPAEKKSWKWSEAVADINVESACLRLHRAEFAVR